MFRIRVIWNKGKLMFIEFQAIEKKDSWFRHQHLGPRAIHRNEGKSPYRESEQIVEKGVFFHGH
jgi:hypothetical protein